MKVILSLSIAGLIYFGSNLGLSGPLDISGTYYATNSNPKVGSSLFFSSNGAFEYSMFFLEGPIQQTKIRGTYTTKGSEISLVISETESKSSQRALNKNQKEGIIKIRGRHKGKINKQTNPVQLTKVQTYFEAGSLKLKPKYFIKLTKGKLMLCLKDFKKDQFEPVFKKEIILK